MPPRQLEILLVEDNPGDVRLTKEILREGSCDYSLNVARDGLEALAYLRQEGDHGAAPRPDMILLDLNLPRKDGREVLQEIKQDEDLCRIPVVVLTTSADERDVQTSYDLHANCYITKPVDVDRFSTVVRSIETFWLEVARLPPA